MGSHIENVCGMNENGWTNYLVENIVTNPKSPAKDYLIATAEDAYKRLIAPSIENEIRSDLTERAQNGAISLFSVNLKNMDGFMQMLGGFTVLRMTSMLGMVNVSFTKEELLALNAQLNKIKKPKNK